MTELGPRLTLVHNLKRLGKVYSTDFNKLKLSVVLGCGHVTCEREINNALTPHLDPPSVGPHTWKMWFVVVT